MTVKVEKADLEHMRFYPGTMQHPKIAGLTAEAQVSIIKLWSYCHQYRTDGLIPDSIETAIPIEILTELRAARLVEPRKGGYLSLHDYLEWQPSRDQLERFEEHQAETARKRREAGQAAAASRWGRVGAK